jgi:hypothetical protein
MDSQVLRHLWKGGQLYGFSEPSRLLQARLPFRPRDPLLEIFEIMDLQWKMKMKVPAALAQVVDRVVNLEVRRGFKATRYDNTVAQ